jgi:hypothetical protein
MGDLGAYIIAVSQDGSTPHIPQVEVHRGVNEVYFYYRCHTSLSDTPADPRSGRRRETTRSTFIIRFAHIFLIFYCFCVFLGIFCCFCCFLGLFIVSGFCFLFLCGVSSWGKGHKGGK